MNDKKFLKVMFGNKGVNYEYKIDEVNIAETWSPDTYELAMNLLLKNITK